MNRLGRHMLMAGLVVMLGAGGFYLSAYVHFGHTTLAQAQTLSAEERAKLQAQYDQLQTEIAQYQKIIDDTRAKAKSLQGDVTQLDAQIKKAQAEINQRNVTISTLSDQISQKSQAIATLEVQLNEGHASLAKLLREKDQSEKTSLVVLALASGSLSDFFGNVDQLDSLNQSLQTKFDELKGIQTKTVAQKQALADQQNKQLDARHDAQVLKQSIDQSKQQKTELLTVTKGQESAYNTVLAQKQKQANDIRNALFNLRDTSAISFETALSYATQAQQATGVRAAFILGILRQESNLGSNVGQCYLVNAATGAGKGKNTGTPMAKVMHPTRDVPPFLDLMSRLGIDPYAQVVSCPQSVGYGGAMGPSQFIASTWKGYESRIVAATGSGVADPWNARHAIMATALYMKDLGAGAQTYSAERKAAASYYAGANWQTSAALKYAASVNAFADQYQSNIDFLNNL